MKDNIAEFKLNILITYRHDRFVQYIHM
jgi:hypothetical protein